MSKVTAFLGNRKVNFTFPVNPRKVSWGYAHNSISTDTQGGRVIQLLSVKFDTLSVSGDLGSKRELQRFAGRVAEIMDYQVATQHPVKFKVPTRNWNFNVYVKDVPGIGFNNETLTYPYSMSLEVDEDFGVTTDYVLKNELKRLAKNVGYDPRWHGGDVAALEDLVSSAGSGSNGTGSPTSYSGSRKDIAADLKDGFEKSGRDDLAKAVDTKSFDKWIGQESGWNPENVSPPNNQGKVNGGLFQFWAGHTWTHIFFSSGLTKSYDQGNRFRMSPFEQAKAVAQHFSHLTPQRIEEYGREIDNGTYGGWG